MKYHYRKTKKEVQLERNKNNIILMSPNNIKQIIYENDLYSNPEFNEKLYLHLKGFVKIENLEPYYNCKTLWLENNIIKKIENLDLLQKLTTLYLHSNQIHKIEGLDKLINLRVLNLSNNFITRIQGMKELQQLENFNISQNQIECFQEMKELIQNQSITNLNLSKNQLKVELDEYLINYFENFPNIVCLDLQENPFKYDFKNYRKKMVPALKSLKNLDQRAVSVEERRLTQAWKEGGLAGEQEEKEKIFQEKRQSQLQVLKDKENIEKNEKRKQGKIAFFKRSLEEYSIKRDGLIAGYQQKVEEGVAVDKLQSYLDEIKVWEDKMENTKQALERLDQKMNAIKPFVATIQDDGSVIIHNRTDEQAEQIRKEFYADLMDRPQFQNRQEYQQQEQQDEQSDLYLVKNREQYMNNDQLEKWRQKKMRKLYQWNDLFDEILELSLEQNNFDFQVVSLIIRNLADQEQIKTDEWQQDKLMDRWTKLETKRRKQNK